MLFTTITCVNVKEKSTVNVESPSVGQMFRALIQNDQAMTVVITIVLINCAVYTTSNLVIYFFKYDFGGEGWYNSYTLFNTFGGAVQILSMMILFPLLRKFMGTIQVFYTDLPWRSSVMWCFWYWHSPICPMWYCCFIPGFFIFGANVVLTVLTTVFLANTVDYGQLKIHRRDESVIFSMQTFVVKLASGVAALIASICLQICNLSNDTTDTAAVATAAASSVVGLRMTMTILPIICLLCGILFSTKSIF